MATPVTLKQMEEAKKRAEVRKKNQQSRGLSNLGISYGWTPDYMSYRQPKNIDFTADLAGGRQYTSFEKKNGVEKKPRAPAEPAKLEPQEVVDIPLSMDTDDYKISPDNVLCFSGTQHFLSNFYPSVLNIDGHDYQSVEHYYQACKLYTLAGAEYASQLRNVLNPGRVKIVTKRILKSLHIGNDLIEEWKRTHGFVLIHHALVHKFVQNVDLRQKLLETGEKILAHAYDRDNFFACGASSEDVEKWAKEHSGEVLKIPIEINGENLKYVPLVGNGKNLLGAICMKVRKQLVNYNKKEETDPLLMALLDDFKLTTISDNKPGPASAKAQ